MARRIPLNELCMPKVPTLPNNFDDIIDYIDISSIDNESKKIVAHQEIDGSEAPSRARQLLDVGDVIVSTVRPNLNAVAFVDTTYGHTLVGSTGYCVLRTKEGVDNRFVFYFCQSPYFVEDMTAQATGASYPAVTASIVRNATVPDYPLEQQKEIVRCLDSVSTLISLRKQQIAKLDELVKSRFIEMFGDNFLNPFRWKKELLGAVCDVRDGTHDSPQYFDTGYPLVTSKNVTGGKIDLTDCSLICETDFKKINERSKVDIGDIIMPMIGTVGKPVIVDIEPNFAIKNVSLIKFKPDSKVLNIYIRTLLQSDYFDDVVLSKVRGGTQKFISLGDIRNLEVLVPPIDVQEQFAAFAAQIDKSKLTIQHSLAKLETLKNSLMQMYFG